MPGFNLYSNSFDTAAQYFSKSTGMEKMEPTGSGTIKGVHSPGNVERLFEFKPPGFSWRVGEKQDDIFGILLSPLASVIPKFKIRSSSPAFCKSTLNSELWILQPQPHRGGRSFSALDSLGPTADPRVLNQQAIGDLPARQSTNSGGPLWKIHLKPPSIEPSFDLQISLCAYDFTPTKGYVPGKVLALIGT